MHRSIDLGYYIPEASINYYPSLMSPLKYFSPGMPGTNSSKIIDRLQADTELRIRARQNPESAAKLQYTKTETKIEDVLIRKGKERELRLMHLIEKEERKQQEMLQEKPIISQNSKNIMKYKESSNGGQQSLGRSKGEEKKVLEGSNENLTAKNEKIKVVGKNFPKITADLADANASIKKDNSEKILIKQLESSYKLLHPKFAKEKESKNKVKVRNYIPQFSKPLSLENVNRANKGGITPVPVSNTEKIAVRPISKCTVAFNDALTYTQIIRNRIMLQEYQQNHK
jgi:hypothetical protein